MSNESDVTTIRCISCGEVGNIVNDVEIVDGEEKPVLRCTKCGWWG
jgi:uncharacterized Zn finger protein